MTHRMLRRVAVSLSVSAVTTFGQLPDTITATSRLATTAVLTSVRRTQRGTGVSTEGFTETRKMTLLR